MYTTLISVQQLKELQASGQAFMVFDCSCDLMKPEMADVMFESCLLYTSPSPRDYAASRMPSSA